MEGGDEKIENAGGMYLTRVSFSLVLFFLSPFVGLCYEAC